MRAIAIAIGLTLGASLAGCESAEEKCDVARSRAAETLRPTVDEAVTAQREAEQARTNAMSDAARCAMDLGNLRSDAVTTALPGTEAAIGVEVAVGAMIAAMLAVDELAPDDDTRATAVSAVVTEELGGRYGTLMEGATVGAILDVGAVTAWNLTMGKKHPKVAVAGLWAMTAFRVYLTVHNIRNQQKALPR